MDKKGLTLTFAFLAFLATAIPLVLASCSGRDPTMAGAAVQQAAIPGEKPSASSAAIPAAGAPKSKAISFFDQNDQRGAKIGAGIPDEESLLGIWIGRKKGSLKEEAWQFELSSMASWPLPEADPTIHDRSAGYYFLQNEWSLHAGNLIISRLGETISQYSIGSVYGTVGSERIGGFDLALKGETYEFVRFPV